MPIRFACPSCQQPIEIDEHWSSQAVACPYCKNIVTAPSSSTWPGAEVPMASPAGGFSPPPPPHGSLAVPTATRSGAGWALTLALSSAVLCLLAWFVFASAIGNAILNKVGRDQPVSREQLTKEYQEMLTSGSLPHSPLSSAAVVVGVLCAIGGVAMGIASLVRQDPRRGMAISAVLVSIVFLLCQLVLGMALLMAATGQPLS